MDILEHFQQTEYDYFESHASILLLSHELTFHGTKFDFEDKWPKSDTLNGTFIIKITNRKYGINKEKHFSMPNKKHHNIADYEEAQFEKIKNWVNSLNNEDWYSTIKSLGGK